MKILAEELGIGKYYKYLPMILLWRVKNNPKLGQRIDKKQIREYQKKGLVGFEVINHIMQKLPEHMLFIIRASNLVAIHNGLLGGSTRQRLIAFSNNAYSTLYQNTFSRRFNLWVMRVKLFLFENFAGIYRFFFPSKTQVL